MTLVVYKNKHLAADSRSTHVCSSADKTVCAHCQEKSRNVSDDATKLRTPRDTMFRGDKIVALGGAGNASMVHRFEQLIRVGNDIEAIFNAYIGIHGKETEHKLRCTLLIVGQKKVYRARIIERGPLQVVEYELDAFVAIGGSCYEAEFLNRISPEVTAMEIVQIMSDNDKGIGGKVSYVKTDMETPCVIQLDVLPAGEAIGKVAHEIKIGRVMIQHERQHEIANKMLANKHAMANSAPMSTTLGTHDSSTILGATGGPAPATGGIQGASGGVTLPVGVKPETPVKKKVTVAKKKVTKKH